MYPFEILTDYMLLMFFTFSTQDAGLWSQALSYFAKKEEDCKEHIIVVLNRIFW